jgi:hypothetical protein
MRISETVTLEIKNNSTWVDYSDGVIDVGILRGIQGYKEIWQTPEAGVLTLVTRNPDIDPYANPAIRMGRQIRVKANSQVLFTGTITDINVDYQPKGKPPITTIVAVDMIGQMALHALSDGFTEQLGSSMDIYAMFQELSGEIVGWNNPYREISSLWAGNASGVTSSGTNALNVAKILAQTQIQFFYADRNNDMYLYNRMNKKKDETIKLQFDSRGGATSYREIELSDNFEVLTNQLSIKNQGYNSNVVPLYTNSYSVNQWGQAKKDFGTQITGLPAAQGSITDDLKNVIFQDSVHPSREIYSITWDASLNQTAAATTDILDNVFVYHEVDPQDIARKYGIIGIEHRITDDEWTIKYYLKNHFIYDTNFPTPVIATDHPAGATINDDVILSITNASSIDLTNATYAWKYQTGTLPITLVGTTFSTVASPSLNYSLGQEGLKNITCTVTDSYGFTKISNQIAMTIYGAAPTTVTTSYTINPNDTAIYTFTATTTEATSYTFYWGDGESYTTTNNIATHRYTTTGTKSVYVTASNIYGSTNSATTSINVQFTPFPVAEVGTFPLRYIAISHPAQNVTGPGTVYPVFGRLQLNTSNAPTGSPSTDPQVNRALIGSWQMNINKEPYSTSPTGINQYVVGNPQKINVQSGQTVTSDWVYYTMPTSGTFHTTTVFDMGGTYYDIKDIRLTFKNISTTLYTSDEWNVWVTDNINETFDFNTSRWWKIGTLNSGSIAPNGTSQVSIITLPYISLPLNAEPFPSFTYTIGNTSSTITQDKYTFSTDDYLTASYLWNFGDGTTSTLQNPVHAYATSGSKTVTLTKYDAYGNSESSSQTFTVNRIADEQGTKPVRYVRIRQNSFSATTNGPMIGSLQLLTSQFLVDRAIRRHIKGTKTDYAGTTTTTWWKENGPNADVQITDLTNQVSPYLGDSGGYAVYPSVILTTPLGTGTTYYTAGVEPRNAAGTTQWDIMIDLGTNVYDIKTIKLFFNRNNLGTSTGTRPTYRIEFSSDNVNWTHVANISTPSSMSGATTWYQGTTSNVASLPLNL